MVNGAGLGFVYEQKIMQLEHELRDWIIIHCQQNNDIHLFPQEIPDDFTMHHCGLKFNTQSLSIDAMVQQSFQLLSQKFANNLSNAPVGNNDILDISIITSRSFNGGDVTTFHVEIKIGV